ncbi:MAG: FAD-dependent oxidoreductase [Methylococcales bacterium]
MSQFIIRMAERARQDGVRIFLSEPAEKIRLDAGGNKPFTITTPSYSVKAKRLVIAVDAKAFRHVRGNLAKMIQAQPQFNDLVGVKVVKIAQWWPNAWWLSAVPGKDVRRAWTTEHCLNAIEIPINRYEADQMVTRSVHDDDIRCVNFWEYTARLGTQSVEAEIRRGIEYLFPGVSIPTPLKTRVPVWPAAWYGLRGGSPFTNADIAQWALEPIPGVPVSLVGESYNPQRSGWSDGAYKSSINTLNAKFAMNLPVAPQLLRASTASLEPSRRSSRSQGH